MLKNVAKTHTILHDNYKHLSLVHGAIGLETGVIRRLYDLGEIFPVYGKDTLDRNIIEKYKKLENTDPIARLIHTFFYRIPGSTADTGFGPTTQLHYDDPETVVQTLAKILALCENTQAEDQIFRDALKLLATHKNLKDLAPKLIQNPLRVTGKNRPAWQLFIKQLALHKKKNQPNYPEQVAYVATITKFCEDLNTIQNDLHALLKPQILHGAHMGHIVLNSLRESDSNDKKALYPSYVLQMILLTFVYKKYSHDRNLLRSFYGELNNNLGKKLLIPDINYYTWITESFEPVNQATARNEIETILSAENPTQSIQQHFDKLVYYASQIRSFPAPVSDIDAVYEYEHGKKTLKFTNCMDNTMRNFINVYAYDAEHNQFALETLQSNTGKSTAQPNLANFLKIFGDVNSAPSPEAHNAWLQVISNIPYAAYNQVVDGASGQSKVAINKGYIAIPKNVHFNSLVKGYQIIENNQYGYELQPSIKNIIIVLDHLLQLDLFADAGGLAKVFMRSNFIAIYFPKLCTALKATGFLSTQKDAQNNEPGKNFDALDYTKSLLYTTINVAGIVTKFETNTCHGEIGLLSVEGIQDGEEEKLQGLLQNIERCPEHTSLHLLMTNLLCKQKIHFNHLTNNPEYAYINLFAAPLENTALLLDPLQIFEVIKPTTPLTVKILLKNVLCRLAEKQPHMTFVCGIQLMSIATFLTALSNDDVQNKDADFPNKFKNYIKFASDGIAISNNRIKEASLILFIALVRKNQGCQEALQAAQGIFTDTMQKATEKDRLDVNRHLRLALILFQELVIKAPEETKQVIQQVLNDPNLHLNDHEKEELNTLLA